MSLRLRDAGASQWLGARAELLCFFLLVCDAIGFAHQRGVIHRDLKPRNVMIDALSNVYLMDWGLARVMPDNSIQLSGPPDDRDDGSGTAAYMAPEQAHPGWRPIGPHTDLFALGAILYEILAGRPPHVAESIDELRQLSYRSEISSPEAVAPCPPALARIALVATSREPQHRHESVEALKQEIFDALG